MRAWQIVLLLAYSFGIALGQLLFKQAAISLKAAPGTQPFVLSAATNLPLILAVTLYAGLTALWVYILSITDLSKAYPFHALTLVLTPLLAARLFDERLTPSFYLGLGSILAGVFIIAWGSTPR